jgi:hypothetical protein
LIGQDVYGPANLFLRISTHLVFVNLEPTGSKKEIAKLIAGYVGDTPWRLTGERVLVLYLEDNENAEAQMGARLLGFERYEPRKKRRS